MIYVLEDTDQVKKLFEGWEETLIYSCLQKVMGKVYVTDLEHPKSAMAFVGCFAFYAGEPDKELVAEKPEGFIIMVPQNEAWAAVIEECFPDSKKVTRYAIKKDTQFNVRYLLDQRARFSKEFGIFGYEMKTIDGDMYDLCMQDPVTKDFVSSFESKERYLEWGRGVVILKNGRIVSGASSYTRYHEGIEIEVDTVQEERRKGLATICCSALILNCLEEGLYPSWDAQNLNSVHLAEKLGYEFSHEYIAYEVWKENVMMTYEDLKDKTLKELLENPILSAVAKDAIRKMDLSKEEYYTWTLQEIADKMGWRNLERGFQKLLAVASKGEYCFKLYDPSECEGNPEKESAHIVFFPSDEIMAKDRPYLFLVPGGGLVNVWNLTEGWPVARTFNELGYNVVILTYQVDIDENALVAMEDFARAFEIIAAKKEEFHVDPQKYITCGFSSGGYLVCLWNSEKGYRAYNVAKPSGCFPIYSMTSYRLLRDCVDWDDEQEMEECALETVGCSMEEACNSCFEIPEHVEGFPPTYIVTMDGDNVCNPEHSKMLAKALEAAKIPYQFELGENGWHGFADGIGMSMEGWPERATNWLKTLEG